MDYMIYENDNDDGSGGDISSKVESASLSMNCSSWVIHVGNNFA